MSSSSRHSRIQQLVAVLSTSTAHRDPGGTPAPAASGCSSDSTADGVETFASTDIAAAAAAVRELGFCVLRPGLLPAAQVATLNSFCDSTRESDPAAWGISGGRAPVQSLAQPLLDYPELDRFARHPLTYELASAVLSPAAPRFAQVGALSLNQSGLPRVCPSRPSPNRMVSLDHSGYPSICPNARPQPLGRVCA